MPMPSIPNAMNMVFSRPSMSETQPKNGLVRPLSTRSIVAANVRGHGHGHYGNRNVVEFPVDGDRLEIGRYHQTAGPNDHEHEIHQPEDRMTNHLHRLVVAPALEYVGVLNYGGDLAGFWCEQEK